VASVEPLAAGSVNSNFVLTTSDGRRYFARIYEEQGAQGAEAERRLLEGLAEAGLPVVTPLRQEGAAAVTLVHGKPFAVYPWVDGAILCQQRVEPIHAEHVGAALARMHLATERVGSLPEGRFRIEDLRARLDRIDREGPRFGEDVAFIRERLAHYAPRRDPALPSGLCHGDLFRDNVLWDGDRIAALIDFESASRGTFAFDLAVCLLAWCYGASLEVPLASAMLRGYHAVRGLGSAEREGILVEGAIAALRFATTRITDFSMRAAEGQPPKRDYRRFLERLRALESGVLDAPLAAL
jgi:homoserine kinase type II